MDMVCMWAAVWHRLKTCTLDQMFMSLNPEGGLKMLTLCPDPVLSFTHEKMHQDMHREKFLSGIKNVQ